MARDLQPLTSKHVRMLALKPQLELSGDVVMQQFAAPGHYEGVAMVCVAGDREALPAFEALRGGDRSRPTAREAPTISTGSSGAKGDGGLRRRRAARQVGR